MQDRAVQWTDRSDERPERKRRAGTSLPDTGRTGSGPPRRRRNSFSWHSRVSH